MEIFLVCGKQMAKYSQSRKKYLLNAYRLLLTTARQGMIIVFPEGNIEDHTRNPEYYNSTFNYLLSFGIIEIKQKVESR